MHVVVPYSQIPAASPHSSVWPSWHWQVSSVSPSQSSSTPLPSPPGPQSSMAGMTYPSHSLQNSPPQDRVPMVQAPTPAAAGGA